MIVLVVYFVSVLMGIALTLAIICFFKFRGKKKPVVRILKGYGEFFDQYEKEILKHRPEIPHDERFL